MTRETTAHNSKRAIIHSMNLFIKLLFGITFFTFCSCFDHWTEAQKRDFEKSCNETDTVKNMYVQFRGFELNELDTVFVKEYRGAQLLDSFQIKVEPPFDPWHRENKVYFAMIEKTVRIENKYLFIVRGQQPYVLDNMKMIMWAQYTMSSEGWGCQMGNYTIDSTRFKDNATPEFIKRTGHPRK